jgi:hypothetical protein
MHGSDHTKVRLAVIRTQNWCTVRTEADLPTGAVVKVKKCRKCRKKKNTGLLFHEAGGRSAGATARHDRTVKRVKAGTP